ncbi:MAG: SRPBCC domain-containing protein [Luteimonas sp.]
MVDSIHQEVRFAASPERLYRILTDATSFSGMSGGAPAEIDATAGGAFSCFGGMILGRNIELVPNERIVQAWRVKTWEPGVYSIARFDLRASDDGTLMVFDHTGFPTSQGEHLASGWQANYWDPMRRAVE